MQKFEVKFDGTSFTSNPDLTELELGEAELATLNDQLKSRGELPAGVFGVVSASVSPDDGQEDDDCKVFITITLLMEAENEHQADYLEAPAALMEKVVAALIGDKADDGLELDGAYEVLEVNVPEAA